MSRSSNFNDFIQETTGTTINESENTFDVGILEQKQLLEILCFYRLYGRFDWFGCTGVNGIYYTYEYKYNYRKPNEVVYKFKSEYNLP